MRSSNQTATSAPPHIPGPAPRLHFFRSLPCPIGQEVATWRACVEAHGQKHCVRHYHPQQLVKGMYSEFIMVSGGVRGLEGGGFERVGGAGTGLDGGALQFHARALVKRTQT